MAASRSVVIGVAGHIDHGKTALVRALTGVDTDRLPEEKKRGMTIELGFAPWKLNRELEASLIDMPGHEAFVKTMVAGAGGLDALLLVVSAEDGVMPQTREHLQICRLLGISRCVVALSKSDRLEDAESLALVEEDIRQALASTTFADASIIPCSAHNGIGLAELQRAVVQALRSLRPPEVHDTLLLPIDRVFSMHGHGTVLTGTILEGELRLPRDAQLLHIPVGEHRSIQSLRVRALQIRGQPAQRSLAGTRTSINVAKYSPEHFQRGDLITRGIRAIASQTIHVELEHLHHDQNDWMHKIPLQLCAGTAHTSVQIDPLLILSEPDDLKLRSCAATGGRGVVRLRLRRPLPVWRDQRVILRAASQPHALHFGRTVGGGRVIDPQPNSERRYRARWISLARIQIVDDPIRELIALVQDAGYSGISTTDLLVRMGPVNLETLKLERSVLHEGIFEIEGAALWVHGAIVDALAHAMCERVAKFQSEYPHEPGISRAELLEKCPPRTAKAIAVAALSRAIEQQRLIVSDADGHVSLPGSVALSRTNLPQPLSSILELYTTSKLPPPTLYDVEDKLKLDKKTVLDAVSLLQRSSLLVRVNLNISMTPEAHTELLRIAKHELHRAGQLSVQTLKRATGMSRKYCVPMMEYFDRIGITVRRGDIRYPGPRAEQSADDKPSIQD